MLPGPWPVRVLLGAFVLTAIGSLLVLPLDHGFTSTEVAVLTEQDMLGDRLVRRRKKRKGAAAFLSELATLSPGDLVVHADHGIGRYEGLTSIEVGKNPHDCVALEYARGNKLYVPVENIELLTRYGSDSDGVTLDSLGGEAWQRRKSRMKERIREIAGELIKTAAIRATRAQLIRTVVIPGILPNLYKDLRLLFGTPEFPAILLANVILGMAYAFSMPFMSLFGTREPWLSQARQAVRPAD